MIPGVVRGCTPPMCTSMRMHIHAHACMHVWHHREFPGIPPMGMAICMKLSCLPRMHVCACMYVHVHMCGGNPPTTPFHPPPTNHPHPHPPTHPQSHREPKTPKFNKSWTNRDNLILFWRFFTSEHSWTHIDYSWSPQTPTHPPAPAPRADETQIGRITITLVRIEIIQFCLKICDPWTLLHTYRLGLICRWGVSYSKWHFYVFDAKMCSCDPPIKNFPVFALDPIKPYLD